MLYSCFCTCSEDRVRGQVAQLVEHRTENAGVAGSIPALATSLRLGSLRPIGSDILLKGDRSVIPSGRTSQESVVFRTLALSVAIALCACSKTPANASANAKPASAQAAPAAAPQPAKPVPAQLPEIIARVNGETVTKAEFERAVASIEARAGGPVPTEQRDQIFRNILDQVVSYKLLVQ